MLSINYFSCYPLTFSSFAFSEIGQVVFLQHVFEACLQQLGDFLFCFCNFDVILVHGCVLEERPVDVNAYLGALDAFVAQDFFDVCGVLYHVAFHCSFPVAEGAEVDF